jgi:hypothetical protein
MIKKIFLLAKDTDNFFYQEDIKQIEIDIKYIKKMLLDLNNDLKKWDKKYSTFDNAKQLEYNGIDYVLKKNIREWEEELTKESERLKNVKLFAKVKKLAEEDNFGKSFEYYLKEAEND